MKVVIHAVGRMRPGPEKELVTRYLDRFARSAPPLGLEFGGVAETAEGRAKSAGERRREEAAALESLLSQGAALVLLDERGKNLGSQDFAERIGRFRDAGQRVLVLAIGGPDGHAEGLRGRAALSLAFGAQTWPHQLARAMLAEQLYRAATILSGHPYHRA